MDAMILALSFVAAVVVSGSVVVAFSLPIDDVLTRLIPGDMAQAWSRYVKFALFTAAFAGGLRLSEISAVVTQRSSGAAVPPLTVGQGLLDVFKSIIGSLEAASWTLLIFFGATLIAYAASRMYDAFGKREIPRGDRHPMTTGRL